MNVYDLRRFGTVVFLLISLGVVAFFLYVSNNLVSDLARQERERMQIWADATKQIADIGRNPQAETTPENLEFLLSIIQQNHTIPVLLVDDDGSILDHRNFDLPEPLPPDNPFVLSPVNERFLRDRLVALEKRANVIPVS